MADEYPSLELLLPGNYIFDHLISIIEESGIENLAMRRIGREECEKVSNNPLVMSFNQISNTDEKISLENVDLKNYCKEFKDIRS
ncbi:MAG: hypothetical protein ABEJ36_00230 [Candidatus Nanosalina sp.]